MLENSVSKMHNLVYIHIPKTGGNSIKSCLGGFAGDSHFKLADFGKEYSEYNFASFVRNPWERCFSAYYYLLKGGAQNELDLKYKQDFIDPYKTFEEFITKGLIHASKTCLHFLPQVEFLKSKTHKLSFIGKLEHIVSDFYLMCQQLQVIPCKDLIKLNQSFKPNYVEYFTHEMKVVLYNIYMYDCNVLGYRFNESTFNINANAAFFEE